jgi:hypothetical protein
MMQRWWMHFPLCSWGWRQSVATATALHITGTLRGIPSFVLVALAVAIAIAIAIAISVAIADSVAVTVAVAHCRRCCCRPLPLWLLSIITTTISVAFLLSAIAIAIALAVGCCHLCHCQPSQLPSLLAITVVIAAGHFQDLLPWRGNNCIWTIFCFSWTVGSTLIKAGWLTRGQAAMANTSIGRQVASSEQLVREVAGSRGTAGGQQDGDIDWPWESCFVELLGYQPLTDGICDDVLDVVEGIAGETVLSHLLVLRNTVLKSLRGLGRSRLSKCDEKWTMRFYFNLRMNDPPLRNMCTLRRILHDVIVSSVLGLLQLGWNFYRASPTHVKFLLSTGVYIRHVCWGGTRSYPRSVGYCRYALIP